MKTKQMTEDYMKTIYILSKEGNVRCFQLADRLAVSRPTVSISLKTLAEDGLVYFEKKAVHLTAEGLKIAKAVEERYQVLYRFLRNLGVSAEIASRDACKMEHVLSDESFLHCDLWNNQPVYVCSLGLPLRNRCGLCLSSI